MNKLISKILFDFTLKVLFITFYDNTKAKCAFGDGDMPDILDLVGKLEKLEGMAGAMKYANVYAPLFTVIEEDSEESEESEEPIVEQLMLSEMEDICQQMADLGIDPSYAKLKVVKELADYARKNKLSPYHNFKDSKLFFDRNEDIARAHKPVKYDGDLIVEVFNDFDSGWLKEVKYYPEVNVIKFCKDDGDEMMYTAKEGDFEGAMEEGISVGTYYNAEIKNQRTPIYTFGKIELTDASPKELIDAVNMEYEFYTIRKMDSGNYVLNAINGELQNSIYCAINSKVGTLEVMVQSLPF